LFFLWGALISLFAQLFAKSSASADQPTGEDDFGLGVSRLFALPVIGGMAGLGGVVIGAYGGELLKHGLDGLTTFAESQTMPLASAFLPGTTPSSLLFAAVFALSPNLLIFRLQSAAGFQQSLSSTSVGDGGARASAGGGK
jgi:hypothetical protein